MRARSDQGDSFHIESHAALLQQAAGVAAVELKPQPHLDAIVVPTIRPGSLETVIALASEIGCALVVLCTTHEQAIKASRECGTLAGHVLVTYLSPSHEIDLMAFLTSEHPENGVEPSCHVDIARKRNVGLLLSRLCGWRTVMFLDDDIRDITAGAASQAAALTVRFQAASFEIGHYPDNSVVCHAHRLAGGNQGVFPGGSALVIDVTQSDTLFPPIYNEDWLFLFDAVQRRSVAVAGALSQLEYRPFSRPRRAASEEFGDVIAEGLYRLLHEGGAITDATHLYWRDTLERRLQLIDHIANQLLVQKEHAPMTGYALMSLAAARKQLAGITELSCLSFVRAWQTDVDTWRKRLNYLPMLADLPGAAKYLDLPDLDRLGVIVTGSDVSVIAPSAQIAPTAVIGSLFRPLLDGRQVQVDGVTRIEAGVWIGQFAVVGQGVTIGMDSLVEDYVGIQAGTVIGERVVVASRSWIGIGVTVGNDSVIKGHIGDSTRIGTGCRIAGDFLHRQLDPSLGWDDADSQEPAPIVEDGAFVGWRAAIVGGVNIGAGAYVCAGALVTRDVPAGHIASGRNQIVHPSKWPGALGKSPFFQDGRNAVQ